MHDVNGVIKVIGIVFERNERRGKWNFIRDIYIYIYMTL